MAAHIKLTCPSPLHDNELYAKWLKSILQIALVVMTAREAAIKRLMIQRIRYLERSHTKETTERRKLESVVEEQRRTIKKLRAQIPKNVGNTMKTMLKKPAMK